MIDLIILNWAQPVVFARTEILQCIVTEVFRKGLLHLGVFSPLRIIVFVRAFHPLLHG